MNQGLSLQHSSLPRSPENLQANADGPEDSIDIAGLIDSLQGQWEDDIGLKITVDGNEVAA